MGLILWGFRHRNSGLCTAPFMVRPQSHTSLRGMTLNSVGGGNQRSTKRRLAYGYLVSDGGHLGLRGAVALLADLIGAGCR